LRLDSRSLGQLKPRPRRKNFGNRRYAPLAQPLIGFVSGLVNSFSVSAPGSLVCRPAKPDSQWPPVINKTTSICPLDFQGISREQKVLTPRFKTRTRVAYRTPSAVNVALSSCPLISNPRLPSGDRFESLGPIQGGDKRICPGRFAVRRKP